MRIVQVRAVLRLSCAFFAVAILGASGVAPGPLCGDPIASSAQRGSFTKISLGSQCDAKNSNGPAVSLSVENAAPIFWIGQLADGVCRMTLGTIANDAFVSLAQTRQDVGDQAPIDAGGGEYWSNSSDHAAYVRIDARTHVESLVEPITRDARVRSLASDKIGKAYGLEILTGGTGGARLVDLQTRVATDLPRATYTRALERGADGRLYFEQIDIERPSHAPCTLFAIDAGGNASDMTTCGLVGDTTVGAPGTMWDATELGVVLRDVPNDSETLYAPVFAPPCNNFSPTSSYTHDIVADARGNAWFVLEKLWHVDRRGKVTSIDIPERAQKDAATRGLFETADGSLWLFSKKFVEHFVP